MNQEKASSNNQKKPKKMLRRRPIQVSPCNSTNSTYVKPLRCSFMTESEEDQCQLGRSTKTNSEIFTRKCNSSASCGAWSISSFPEKCPPTPSPICSPISFSPPSEFYSSQNSTEFSNELGPINQTSCIVSNDGKKSASSKQEQTHNEKASRTQYRPKMKNTRGKIGINSKGSRGVKQDGPLKTKPKGNSAKTIRRQFGFEDKNDSLSLVSSKSKDNQLILAAVNREQDEKGCNKNHIGRTEDPQSLGSTSFHVSEGYMGSKFIRYEDSDLESSINEYQRSVTPTPFTDFMSEVKRNEIEAKITAWKAAKALKLTNKLRSKETEISAWESKQIKKARNDVKEFERKMDEKREKAFQKMEQRINEVRRKAEEKKVKKRNEALKKISQLSQVAKKMGATGKLPAFLMILCL
ncbi:uncharacterized protein LOC143883506 isoform X2 [Tasmannia lanceolata]|uniref:uncharacterized protein LOC143883506 isoform X2 n=1 Tax=Tasmannia lanceolata TaxID=3420 RepID=UPI004063197F